MNSWHVGDVAIFVNDGNIAKECLRYIGNECTLLGLTPKVTSRDWVVDMSTILLEVTNNCLKPLPDGNQASSWENCAFKPKDLVT